MTSRGFTPSGSSGLSVGAFAVKPTNAAIAVGTAESGLLPEDTSST